MKNYHTILTTLDTTELDDVLIDFTLKMANTLEVKKIVGAHIIPVILIPNFIKLDPANYFLPTAPAVEKIRAQVFNEIKNKLGDHDWSIEIKIEEGRPFAKLIIIANEVKPDLLVFGKKEKSEGSGITAKRVAHNLDTDILLVPSTATSDIQKILHPTDFSENSYRALQVVQRMQKAMNLEEEISLLHVLDISGLSQYGSKESYKNSVANLKENTQQQFEKFIQRYSLENANLNLKIQITDGENIANTLLQYAQQYDYQFIVMGARGHSYFDNFVFGSVAETLIDLTHQIPVMIIR